ncbi:MAG: hypothetical protein P4M12_10765 [Gammaproteobacteria bacterium]|nr:hypothetical protein [Gammaproteobacteria bacterium]
MVHEREDKYEIQEDGEYHFSDDQVNYEVEPELAQATAASSGGMNKSAQDLMVKYKKPLLGLGSFLVLIFIVYKILAPASTAPVTDFGQNSLPQPVSTMPPIKAAPAQPVAAAPVSTPTPTPAAAPALTPVPAAMPAASVPDASSGPAPSAAPSIMGSTQPVSAAPLPTETAPTTTPSVTIVPASPGVNPMENLPAPPLANVPAQESVQVTEQTPAMKIAEYEAQANAMQSRLQDMTLRLASMESTITRLGQVIQELKSTRVASAPVAVRQAPRVFVPKMVYTVQAIIPGRAWLKSENGDTVTVTEGDTLQGYGRIMKIDPYDGNVQIDVGGKIVSLSYGSANE